MCNDDNCSRMKCPVHVALVIIFHIMSIFMIILIIPHLIHALRSLVHSADDGRPLPLANAMKCTHGWHCCYDSFCVGERMQELLFRVRFNFPKSANWDGMIPFSVHSSIAAVVVHFACYTLHDQRTSSVTDRQSDLLNQPTDELSCPIVSLCSGRRIEVLSR